MSERKPGRVRRRVARLLVAAFEGLGIKVEPPKRLPSYRRRGWDLGGSISWEGWCRVVDSGQSLRVFSFERMTDCSRGLAIDKVGLAEGFQVFED